MLRFLQNILWDCSIVSNKINMLIISKFRDNIFSKKNKVVIHYKWEGSLEKNGSIYSFNAMEIIKTSASGKNVKEISSIWTEKQFLNQFK